MAKESHVALGSASLFVREIGEGHPILVLHGGPDFDHSYLLPEMDRLAESRRLLYYDQRGRGRSAAGVRAELVSLESEIADFEGASPTL
jgi:proline iminopeptidase